MKRLALLFSFIVLLAECTKNADPQVVVYNMVEFKVVDSNGNDLLDPENVDQIDESQIKVFYKVDGQWQEVFDANMDYPRNFFIYQGEYSYRMRVFLNDTESGVLPETLIQWSDSDADTIQAEFNRTSSSIVLQKIWLNGDPIVSLSSDSSDLYYTLIK